MSTWIFFGEGRELVETLAWTLGIAKLEATKHDQRLRRCCQEHAAWLEESTTN